MTPVRVHAQADNEQVSVSIGLPVFNGEKYLEKTLDSILSQTYQDFELIILDNASTDNTQKICRAYASIDSRIRYYRNNKHFGASINFNNVFKLSSGKYFKWAAHDDLLAPEFLSGCVDVLDKAPSIVLCHTKTAFIDEHGKNVGTINYKINDLRKPHERFGYLIRESSSTWFLIYGLIRSSVLRMTTLFGYYLNSDHNLLTEIGLSGRMYKIPEHLFFRRTHPQAYSDRRYLSNKEASTWWTLTRRISFPHWRRFFEYLKSVRRVQLRWSNKLLCYSQIMRWLMREGWFKMIRDVITNILDSSVLARAHNILSCPRARAREKIAALIRRDKRARA